ncbi:LLM class flavin-dependent oxidoreductase [Gordonia westfalica]|uniref:LLM class flavin-dependent oxidoreductase n=1 Tax=Gordonia westfalica TaxID=158898 RepID=A0ABU2GZ46_9ACTN|nr:LLM class flavin-dependent oxidoreductase [Gordonia westfalica]MDS1116737.1 LLM class flavin-dependent oxidoreductase [Gordonia westfalica]
MNVKSTPPVGVLLPTTTLPADLAATSVLVENLGFSELWVGEDYFYLAGPSSAAIALSSTSNITVGIGLVSAVVRHPAVLAMEVSTIAGAFPGRLITGIGHGVPLWTKQMGLYPKAPLKALRAVLDTTGRLLAGEKLTIEDGPYYFDEVELVNPLGEGERAPLYAGVVGPKSLEASGQCADGTIMSMLAGPKYLTYVRERLAAGAARVGRDISDHRIPTFAIYSVSDDRESARADARPVVAHFLAAVGPSAMTEVYGVSDELKDILSLGDSTKIAEAIPDEWIDFFAVAGTPEECVEKIKALLAAGASSVVLAPYPAEKSVKVLEQTAAEVLPLI